MYKTYKVKYLDYTGTLCEVTVTVTLQDLINHFTTNVTNASVDNILSIEAVPIQGNA